MSLELHFYEEKEIASGLSMWFNCEFSKSSSVIDQSQHRFKKVTLVTVKKHRHKHSETNLF